MTNLELSLDETEMLKLILSDNLIVLAREIAATENKLFRKELEKRESVITDLLARLEV